MTPTKRMPLFIISGASCVGKSTDCEILFRSKTDYIVLESDIIWNNVYNTPNDDYRAYRTVQMNLCANIAQAGKPVVLCGCTTPQQHETLPERALFTTIYYLAIVCDDKTMERRVRKGRKIKDKAHLESSLHFNRWLKAHAVTTNPSMELLDNSQLTPEESALRIDSWIQKHLNDEMDT